MIAINVPHNSPDGTRPPVCQADQRPAPTGSVELPPIDIKATPNLKSKIATTTPTLILAVGFAIGIGLGILAKRGRS